jgi:CheY-like chemotaxis protein
MSRNGYLVACPGCGAEFDALEASWCSCLVKERSFTCPNCGRCFCRAPLEWKQRFWADAPPAVWERKRAEKTDGEAPRNEPPESVKRPLVLVVDDERSIRAAAAGAVDELGCGFISASDGEEGLALALLYRPELILTDAFMPKLDGREMALRVRREPDLSSTKIIVMTSLYKGRKYRAEAISRFEADDLVEKPLEYDQLRAILEKHLGRRE